MPRLSSRSSVYRRSGEERVFPDDQGRLWSAAHAGGAMVFTCVTDGRLPPRALAVDLSAVDGELDDDTLRAWLESAPRIGTLT